MHLAVGSPDGDASSVAAVNAGACTVAVALVMGFGAVLATAVNRFANRPARTYQLAAAVLVALSLLAPLTAAATSAGTKLTLVGAHLIAAAIVVQRRAAERVGHDEQPVPNLPSTARPRPDGDQGRPSQPTAPPMVAGKPVCSATPGTPSRHG